MDKDKEFLGTEKIGKLLFRLAVPTVIAQIVNMLYNIVDRIYIGHIPGEGRAALTGRGRMYAYNYDNFGICGACKRRRRTESLDKSRQGR